MSVMGRGKIPVALAEALGFPTSRLHGFTLEVNADELITVTATYLPTAEQLGALIEVVKRYEFEAREQERGE